MARSGPNRQAIPEYGDIVRCHDGDQYVDDCVEQTPDGLWQAVLKPRYQIGIIAYREGDTWDLVEWLPLND